MARLFFYPLIMLIHLTSSQGQVGTLTTAQKQHILNMHNNFRNSVASGNYQSNHGSQPSATDMNELLWDHGLAQLATNYSEQCVFENSNPDVDDLKPYADITTFEMRHGRSTWEVYIYDIGENHAYSSLTPIEFNGADGIEAGVQGWIDEGLEYNYGRVPMPVFSDPEEADCTGETCDNFVQVIWAMTRYIGCGYSDCDGVQGSSYAMNLVCYYYPGGNYWWRYPYKNGTKCSDCDEDRTANCDANYQDGLCAGGVDSAFSVYNTTDVDVCDNGLGQALPNAVCPTPEPTTANPTTNMPTTFSPTTNAPTTSQPTTPNPTTPSPTTPSPTTPNPTTPSPTTPRPTTPSPTTPRPTTPNPTTPSPTTPSPTTPSPTTPSPITSEPTTAVPTTMEPTTTSPTTSEPTTAVDEEPDTTTTQIESTTVVTDIVSTTDDADQCPGLDLEIALFYNFNFNRIQRRCDLCLTEEEFPGQRRADRIERGCEAVGDLLNNITDEYSDCMLNVCNYQCTLDGLTITQDADEEEICGCNIFECQSIAASANGYELWSAIVISSGILLGFIFV